MQMTLGMKRKALVLRLKATLRMTPLPRRMMLLRDSGTMKAMKIRTKLTTMKTKCITIKRMKTTMDRALVDSCSRGHAKHNGDSKS